MAHFPARVRRASALPRRRLSLLRSESAYPGCAPGDCPRGRKSKGRRAERRQRKGARAPLCRTIRPGRAGARGRDPDRRPRGSRPRRGAPRYGGRCDALEHRRAGREQRNDRAGSRSTVWRVSRRPARERPRSPGRAALVIATASKRWKMTVMASALQGIETCEKMTGATSVPSAIRPPSHMAMASIATTRARGAGVLTVHPDAMVRVARGELQCGARRRSSGPCPRWTRSARRGRASSSGSSRASRRDSGRRGRRSRRCRPTSRPRARRAPRPGSASAET